MAIMAGLHVRLALVAAICAALTALSINAAFCVSYNTWIRVVSGLLAVVFLSITCIYTVIVILRPYPRQSLFKVTIHLFLDIMFHVYGKSAYADLLNSCENPMKHQRRLWKKIRKMNGQTTYATDHRLDDITTLEKLRELHPLNNYEPFRPYVERMMEGERNVLVDGKPDVYIRTTGTTGKSKYIPWKDKQKMVIMLGVLWNYVTNDHYPTKLLSKTLFFYVHPGVIKAKDGADIETVVRVPEGKDWILAQYSTPPAGYRISSLHEAFYVQLLFALLDPELGHFLAGFLHFLESTMKLLEEEWRNLVTDIELGTLKADLNLDPPIRESLTNELRKYSGNPARASELQREFEKGFEGIIKRIWPCIPVIMGVDTTGSWKRLSTTYAKGLPLITLSYACSEGYLGVSPGPKYIDKGYIPLVHDTIMEFIKVEDMSISDPPTFFLDELEQDQNYEIVITQPFGLYRYRMGDVIKVTGFYKAMPIIDFLYRTGQMLNLRYEKLDQRVVLDSIRAATGQWTGRTLIEFAVAESTLVPEECSIFEAGELMPYYVFFMELEEPGQPITTEEKGMIDSELRSRNSDVERLRREGAITCPRVHVVRPGSFADLRRFILANTGASANQYKVPRKLRTIDMINVMVKNIVY